MDAETLQQVLVDSEDPQARARAHLELGRLALQEGRYDAAVRHLREALLLDRTLERARHLLADLGEVSHIEPRAEGRRSVLKRLVSKLRGD